FMVNLSSEDPIYDEAGPSYDSNTPFESYSRDPDIFLTQSKSQRQSEEPKEESNSSPHSLWTVFQGNLKFVPKGESVEVFGMASMQPVTKRATPKKPTTTTPVKQTKPAPPPTKKPSKRKLPQKVRKGKPGERGDACLDANLRAGKG
ncbi:hypothetical protein Tco_1332164, partial [Tanacetum coccineum]